MRPPAHGCVPLVVGTRPLAREAVACTAFSVCDRHLMRLRSAVRGKPTCGRRLMRLSPMLNRPNAQLTIGSVVDAADLCVHAAQYSVAADRSDQNVYKRSCPFIGESRGLQLACMKSESSVSHMAMNSFSGLVHTARHTMGAGHARSRYLNRKEGDAEDGANDWSEVVATYDVESNGIVESLL
ncbi:hypothetical protein B296_00037608 [Ensete ventricosum]|uniref:Uncharacterized protein n=1 Tax=Ensete ventricosum TaxID=4639 RepID=A0A426XET3_ENSVE|nr:hypothetical protein B296_00037608 [Ensete ventricosum]